MADTSIILNRIRSHGLFSRSDLRIAMEECGYQTSDGITNHMITRLLDAGGIVRVGRNRYCVADSLKTYHFPHSEFAVLVADEITEAHPYLDFRIFELVQLNEFVNHQIAHNIVFVSVEGELEKSKYSLVPVFFSFPLLNIFLPFICPGVVNPSS